jgi:hypothetical protein
VCLAIPALPEAAITKTRALTFAEHVLKLGKRPESPNGKGAGSRRTRRRSDSMYDAYTGLTDDADDYMTAVEE